MTIIREYVSMQLLFTCKNMIFSRLEFVKYYIIYSMHFTYFFDHNMDYGSIKGLMYYENA